MVSRRRRRLRAGEKRRDEETTETTAKRRAIVHRDVDGRDADDVDDARGDRAFDAAVDARVRVRVRVRVVFTAGGASFLCTTARRLARARARPRRCRRRHRATPSRRVDAADARRAARAASVDG